MRVIQNGTYQSRRLKPSAAPATSRPSPSPATAPPTTEFEASPPDLLRNAASAAKRAPPRMMPPRMIMVRRADRVTRACFAVKVCGSCCRRPGSGTPLLSRRRKELRSSVRVEPGLWLLRSVDHGDPIGRAGLKSRPQLPSRAHCCPAGVGDEVAVDDVADASLEAADRRALGLAGGEFAQVVVAAGAGVAHLRDRDDVDG